MPAIAPNPTALVWEKPSASPATVILRYSFGLHGETTSKAVQEGVRAIRRFRGNAIGTADSNESLMRSMLDPLTAREGLRALAAGQGLDLDALIAGAAQHFTSPRIERRTEPLSEEELEFLIDDDQRAFNG